MPKIESMSIDQLTKLPKEVRSMVSRGSYRLTRYSDLEGIVLIIPSTHQYVLVSEEGEWIRKIDDSLDSDKIVSFIEVYDPAIEKIIEEKLA